ncbi:uncharacterized protein LOC107263268 [Cephus cinctus]|uniref:Uncharacterized protein LOC107263268 n=1 Tax=Cephus cinctus TaxID=211228 RepID=A0AAJ7FD25_CEPCN|nr:uncharacterized protein LOC107263268 [Cephus cinctus]
MAKNIQDEEQQGQKTGSCFHLAALPVTSSSSRTTTPLISQVGVTTYSTKSSPRLYILRAWHMVLYISMAELRGTRVKEEEGQREDDKTTGERDKGRKSERERRLL